MADEVSLRVAAAGDAYAVTDVFLAARRAAMPYLPELHTDEETFAWIAKTVLTENEVHVAEAGGTIIGFLALRGECLEHLYVHPDFQLKGVGSRLLAQAKLLRPHGFRLWVFQRNTQARRFYETRGLRVLELTDGSGNEEREPDALYEWRVG
jgi:GNAT superfamily N-acetyltransferase